MVQNLLDFSLYSIRLYCDMWLWRCAIVFYTILFHCWFVLCSLNMWYWIHALLCSFLLLLPLNAFAMCLVYIKITTRSIRTKINHNNKIVTLPLTDTLEEKKSNERNNKIQGRKQLFHRILQSPGKMTLQNDVDVNFFLAEWGWKEM